MNKPYPLLLRPVIKDYLWGGRRLIDEYKLTDSGDIAAEGWMLACHKDGTNTVINGAHAGKRLDELLPLWGYDPKAFPLLFFARWHTTPSPYDLNLRSRSPKFARILVGRVFARPCVKRGTQGDTLAYLPLFAL